MTELKAMDWAEFLATCPPDTTVAINDLCEQELGPYARWSIEMRDVELYCQTCEGSRFFQCTSGNLYWQSDKWEFDFIHFLCRNCRRTQKIYAVASKQNPNSTSGVAVKLGETPPFGPHTPARVITLIGPDKELFLKGRRAENRGLGIGAFSYYRRVVENQKDRIIGQIAKVAEKLGARPDVLEEFKAAAAETQFSKAIEQIKHGIPDVLLIDGQHNPLTLLHSALSEGLHGQSDEECLEIAKEIRIVLTELAERISFALKKEAELTEAVSQLLNRKSPNPPENAPPST